METASLIQILKEEHHAFAAEVNSMDEKTFLYTLNGKWTPGQQLTHIQKSILPIGIGLKLPLWLIGLIFGKRKTGSESYEKIEAGYRQKLAEGAKAPKPYIPPKVHFSQKEKVCKALVGTTNQLCRQLELLPESAWDTVLMPHPSLGKLTIREMIQFSLAHLRHHRESVSDLLKNLPS